MMANCPKGCGEYMHSGHICRPRNENEERVQYYASTYIGKPQSHEDIRNYYDYYDKGENKLEDKPSLHGHRLMVPAYNEKLGEIELAFKKARAAGAPDTASVTVGDRCVVITWTE